MLTVDLLRHGVIEGGVKYRGIKDDPLTAQGRIEMDKVWQKLQEDVTTIISSPLSRCAVPALDWGKQADIPCFINPQLQELDYGEWEGLTAAEIEKQTPGMLKRWRQNPEDMTPPGGESMADFSTRMDVFLQQLVAEYQEGHVLLVAHSGTIRLLLAHILQAPIISTRHLLMPYACWSRFIITEGKSILCFHAREV